jgi:hypothetical protein
MDGLTKDLVLPLSGYSVTLVEGDGYSTKIARSKRNYYDKTVAFMTHLITKFNDKPKALKEDIMGLRIPDFEFMSLELYDLNYGHFNFTNFCEKCKKDAKGSIDLTTLPFIPLPEGASGPDPLFELVLPRSKKKVKLGYLTLEQEKLIFDSFNATGVSDAIQGEFQAIRLMEGADPVTYEDVLKLKLQDHAAIQRKREEMACGYDTIINNTCDFCGNVITFNILLHRDFLFPGG